MLEKILEEIIEQLKAEGCIIDNDAGHRAVDIIRKHTNDAGFRWRNGCRITEDQIMK